MTVILQILTRGELGEANRSATLIPGGQKSEVESTFAFLIGDNFCLKKSYFWYKMRRFAICKIGKLEIFQELSENEA